MPCTRTRHRRLFPTMIALATISVLPACGGESTAADAPTVEIQLGRFTITPGDLTVPAGALALRVTNVDSIVHNLVVAGRGTKQLAPGATQTIQIDTKPGEYRMWCDVQGHAEMGQTGTLRSQAVAPTSSASPTTG